MFIVVSYDVVDNGRRSKICNELKNYGTRVQYSVFECLLDAGQSKELEHKLLKFVNKRVDKVRIYSLCDGCRRRITVYGTGKVTEDEEIYVV